MDSKTQIIEQYFKLSDLAFNDEQALHEIIQLFQKRLWSRALMVLLLIIRLESPNFSRIF